MPPHVAIYTRISSDPTAQAFGVTLRQLPDCTALAAQLYASHPTKVYTDNDASASRGSKPRPAYLSLLDDIAARRVHAVVTWDLDRLTRDPLEHEAFLAHCETHHMHRISTLADSIRIDSGDGIMVARIKAAVAAEEARKISVRAKRKKRELAEKGAWNGGTVPFGFANIDGELAVVPAEAEVIRDCYRLAADDAPFTVVVARLNASGFPPRRSTTWTRQSTRALLLAARNAGLREVDTDNRTLTGRYTIVGPTAHGPIVDEPTFHKVTARLAPRAHVQSTGGRRRERLPMVGWLSGLLICQLCDGRMVSRVHAGARRYRCHGDTGCGRVSILAAPVENFTHQFLLILAAHHQLDAVDQPPVPTPNDVEASALSQRLNDLHDTYFLGHMDQATYLRLRDILTARLDVVEQVPAPHRVERGSAEKLVDGWVTATVPERARVARAFLTSITVAPYTPGTSPLTRLTIAAR